MNYTNEFLPSNHYPSSAPQNKRLNTVFTVKPVEEEI